MDVCARHILVIGGSATERADAAAQCLAARDSGHSASSVVDASSLPFGLATVPQTLLPRGVVYIPDIHLAFPNGQTGGTRFVVIHSTYVIQKVLDALRPVDTLIITGD